MCNYPEKQRQCQVRSSSGLQPDSWPPSPAGGASRCRTRVSGSDNFRARISGSNSGTVFSGAFPANRSFIHPRRLGLQRAAVASTAPWTRNPQSRASPTAESRASPTAETRAVRVPSSGRARPPIAPIAPGGALPGEGGSDGDSARRRPPPGGYHSGPIRVHPRTSQSESIRVHQPSESINRPSPSTVRVH